MDELFPRDHVEMMFAHLRRMARAQGAGEIAPGDRLSNTRRAIAIAEWARDRGALDAFREAAMSAYWRDGRDLENEEHLRDILSAAGLDPGDGIAAMDDPRWLQRVDAMRAEANERGVTGIPTFFFGDGPVVVGAQPYDVLARAAEQAGASRRGET